ncbi:hypothetical protein [Leucobacter tenebrionis]|uniref:hypothetical protein n=1 Tax=Leucobacter tenebrionis TaxID=2873270 RepID=UPI001CA61A7E|nr:hypothetical protein [Leucobacter tenebrionis]QZY52252.1 hypothetical protein KVY00_01915 [Leucobacter tenebrionis]
MSNIDYAALDAEDNEATPYEHDDEQEVGPVLQETAAPRKRTSKRPLTEEERLERALAQVETLQARVTAKREERRSRLVEDLYRLHNIVESPGDLGEAKRSTELRRALGL